MEYVIGENVLYLGVGALGGLLSVVNWLLFRRDKEKEKFNRWKVVKSMALGAMLGGVLGGQYVSYSLAVIGGIAGESVGTLLLKFTKIDDVVLNFLGRKK